MLKRSVVLFIYIAVTGVFYFNCSEAAKPGKPLPPIKINAHISNNNTGKGIFDIEVIVKPLTNSDEVAVECTIPDGARLLKGKKRWTGKIKKGEKKVLYYTIQAPEDMYYKIIYAAKIKGVKFNASAYSLVEINPFKKKEKRKGDNIKRLPDGSSVIEIKGVSKNGSRRE